MNVEGKVLGKHHAERLQLLGGVLQLLELLLYLNEQELLLHVALWLLHLLTHLLAKEMLKRSLLVKFSPNKCGT